MSSVEMCLEQLPAGGSEHLLSCGDVILFELRVLGGAAGRGYVRTNLGGGQQILREQVRAVEGGYSCADGGWRDVAMRQVGEGRYQCRLPACEVGVFEATCLFMTSEDQVCHWSGGGNVRLKVEPAGLQANNTIYNAFVRQFGRREPLDEAGRAAEELLDRRGYSVVPPSGHFREVRAELGHVMSDMGFRLLQLLPIQPPPTTYARMGRYGSPFAPVDYLSVDPALADFDRRTTPLEQFVELVDAVHARGGLVLLDLPIDHTGWASTLQTQHPEWFCRQDDGSFASPGAWGVVWEDLCKLDFGDRRCWRALAAVFLHWTACGVDGFRCDAGYMVPAEVWRYIVAKVRLQYPDTVFFLEGLGGPPETTTELLAKGGMNWAYSEIFQVYGRDPLAGYLGHLFRGGPGLGVAVNFAETHDNDRLAKVSPAWAKMRTTLAALTSPAGAFGIANGVEWLATERIDVHGASSLNWGAADNLIAHLRSLNEVLRVHPAFAAASSRRLVGRGTALGILRATGASSEAVLVVLNPEEHNPAWLEWAEDDFPGQGLHDLLRDAHVAPTQLPAGHWRLQLPPAGAVCLSPRTKREWLAQAVDANDEQRRHAAVLRAVMATRGMSDLPADQPQAWGRLLTEQPERFLRELLGQDYVPMVAWLPERDGRRIVPWPSGHFLWLRHDAPFRVSLLSGDVRRDGGESFRMADGSWQVLLPPLPAPEHLETLELRLELYEAPDRIRRLAGKLWHLPLPGEAQVQLSLPAKELTARHLGLCSNRRGSYALARARWGELHSKYDALLAASLEQGHPADRWATLLRCHVWLVYRGASNELTHACQTRFTAGYDNTLVWDFAAPDGLGGHLPLRATLRLSEQHNRGTLTFSLGSCDHEPVELIMRPDVDWRSHHQTTTAHGAFAQAVTAHPHGFAFAPGHEACFEMEASGASFAPDGSWTHHVAFAEDAQRCLPAQSDVFSPGYFRWRLRPGEVARCRFGMAGEVAEPALDAVSPELPASLPLGQALQRSLTRYVADRDGGQTVIAGFPWFLDWGRDTLICLRGLVAAGRLANCREIIRAFASFEAEGTIPNMIRGGDSGDRATSDAPLWLCAATRALYEALPEAEKQDLLALDCAGRPLIAILESIVWHYRSQLPNGICGDTHSGLVFSPSHYTWMDTNYPAGTPREGYPVEIQALWLHALAFLNQVTGAPCYSEWREQAARSFRQLFVRADGGGLYDCLRGGAGQAAAACERDDAVRPNQLLALTLCPDCVPGETRDAVLSACAGLLVPGGIRSLDDRPVALPLPIVRDGVLLNDPSRPYWGEYGGDEDTRRKAAYHNGTAWGWQMPLFCEALAQTGETAASRTALALLETVAPVMAMGCLGHLAEIYDGDAPHAGRGCPAQAWSMSEAFRVWKLLMEKTF